MKTNVQTTRRGFTLVELLVVIVIIASLAGLTAPMVIRQRKKADQTEATSNARQIGIAMLEFDTDYGSFPGAATQVQVTANFPSSVIKGGTGNSNGYFKQLMEAGLTQSEAMFYAKVPRSIKPDGNISSNTEALKKGEVGFAYITDQLEGMSSAGNPARAIVAAPFDTGVNFLGDPFDKKAVILRIDNSVTSVNISVPAGATTNSGPAIVGGANLLASTNEIWGGTTPTVQAPDL
jgi:prepilin-type N-terminal cleavage/methylation domain-containing protein